MESNPEISMTTTAYCFSAEKDRILNTCHMTCRTRTQILNNKNGLKDLTTVGLCGVCVLVYRYSLAL